MSEQIEKAFNPGDLYADVPLTGVAVANWQQDTMFAAYRAAPRLIVTKPSGSFRKWTMADFNRDELAVRGVHGRALVGKFGSTTDTFAVDARSLAYDLTEAERLASDVEIDPEIMIPRALALKGAIRAERQLAGVFGASAWYRTVTGGAGETPLRGTSAGTRYAFSNSSSDPVKMFLEEIEDQSLLTGVKPDSLGFGSSAWTAFRTNVAVKSALMYTGSATIRNQPANLDEIAALLGLKYVWVSDAIYNTAADGLAASNARIIPAGSCLLYHRGGAGGSADDPGRYDGQSPLALARVVWAAGAGGNMDGWRIRRGREEWNGIGGSDHSELDALTAYKVVTSEMGTEFLTMS